MNTIVRLKRRFSSPARSLVAGIVAIALTFGAVPALPSDTIVLRVGDQKGGNRSLLEISGLTKDLPYKIEWSEFPHVPTPGRRPFWSGAIHRSKRLLISWESALREHAAVGDNS